MLTLRTKIVLATVVEILYAVSTRVWITPFLEGIELELVTTAVRLLTVGVYWWLFRDIIASRVPRMATMKAPFFITGIVALAAVPVLAGEDSLPDLKTQVVFAATSVIVGLREEILYRGVLQNLMCRRMNWFLAIVCSNVIFTIYHYGAWPFTVDYILEFFLVGSAMGFIYYGTGSLVVAAAAHAIYDAAWCFTPFLEHPLGKVWGSALELAACALLGLWASRLRNTASSTTG